MIENDPFKTREEALKTILVTNSDKPLLVLVNELNHGLDHIELYNYFYSLRDRWPGDFKLVFVDESKVSLFFMNKEVCNIISFKNISLIKDVESFFSYWEKIIPG